MTVSNKKKKTILREHPGKSVPELAKELGLSTREVKAVLRREGRLPGGSLQILLAVAGAAAVVAVLAIGAHSLLSRAGPGKLKHRFGELNVLLVTIDTLRADRLGCYGYHQARTPVIDAIAASGVRFQNVYCHQPVTLPSHATLFTGAHPAYHGIADNGLFMLPGEAVTVAEVLKGEGFSTGAVIASFVLHRQFGLDQGFDTYDDRLSTGRKLSELGFDEMTATSVSDRALEWIEHNAGKRWFLWLHYYDPHTYYEPPPAYQRPGVHPYDGEIAYVDFELGRVMDDLEKRGLADRTLVIITSDHGESLGEHGEPTHGLFLYDAAMRVPLIASLPGVIPAGRVAGQTVSLMDVAPTVLSALGITPPQPMQGRPFTPLLFSDPADWEEEPVILETELPWHQYGWSPSSAMVADKFKLIDAPRPELYDLEADPRELANIHDEYRNRAEAMTTRLKALRADYSESSLEGKAGVNMDDQTRDRLARLGYVFSGPGSSKPAEDAADVKDRVEALMMIKKASALRDSGNEDGAISLLEDVLKQSPDSRRVLNRLGIWYARKKDFQNAEKHLTRLIRLDPDYIEAYENLGELYAESSRLEEATLLAQTALSKFPRSARALRLMGFIRSQAKDYQGSLRYLNQAIEYYPTYHEALVNRAVALYFLGEYEGALNDMKTASRIVPENKSYRQWVNQIEEEMRAR